MRDLMSTALANFGRSIGLRHLAPDDNGAVTLRLSADRQLGLHLAEDHMLVILASPLAAGELAAKGARALMLCERRHHRRLPLHTAVNQAGQLLLITRIEARVCQPHTLEQAGDFLLRVLNQLSD